MEGFLAFKCVSFKKQIRWLFIFVHQKYSNPRFKLNFGAQSPFEFVWAGSDSKRILWSQKKQVLNGGIKDFWCTN